MRKSETYTGVEARPHGKRAHSRRKLSPMAYIELGQENGGILLNLSEGGFAVQSALALTSREFSELRFQVPAYRGWLTASGRIVWLSESKKEAGIQFTELPSEARREILKWVSAENDEPESRPAVPARTSSPRVPGTSTANSRDRELARELPASATLPREQKTGESRPAPVSPAVAVAEPPVQDFRFTEYSMFAAEPERAADWSEPARAQRSWSSRLLVGALVAGSFFVLGAFMGQGGLARLRSYWDGPGTVTESPKAAAPSANSETPADTAKGVGAAPEQAQEANQDRPQPQADSNAKSNEETAKGPEPGANQQEPANPDNGISGKGANAPKAPSAAASASSGREKRPGRTAETLTRSVIPGQTDAGTSGHSILVNAPEPGSRPFYVSLPGEAISASPEVAISARRTLEIPARRPGESGQSERVIIGKLVSHSDPFYPADARSRHLEGSVEIRARVGRTGEIVGITPVSGPGLLTSAAATAVREWRYEPTYIDGDPVETLADIFVVFRLR